MSSNFQGLWTPCTETLLMSCCWRTDLALSFPLKMKGSSPSQEPIFFIALFLGSADPVMKATKCVSRRCMKLPRVMILTTTKPSNFSRFCRWTDAVLWNPYLTMEASYKDFVCVENAQVCSRQTCKLFFSIMQIGVNSDLQLFGSHELVCSMHVSACTSGAAARRVMDSQAVSQSRVNHVSTV